MIEVTKFRGTDPKFCKRCGKLLQLVVYKHREYCRKCWFLKQFRPQEFDPVAHAQRLNSEAKVGKLGMSNKL